MEEQKHDVNEFTVAPQISPLKWIALSNGLLNLKMNRGSVFKEALDNAMKKQNMYYDLIVGNILQK
jgi:hypothetical protein